VLRLDWSDELKSLAPLRRLIPASFGIAYATSVVPNTRAQAIAKAGTFIQWGWTATAEMLARSCTAGNPPKTSIRPSYLTGPGTYINIPYCWGAFDEPGAYVLRIDPSVGYTCGDAETSIPPGWKGCTAGADCSGFIQQCWGIGPPKQNDAGLLQWVVSENSQDVGGSLSPGDMWRWPDQHVRLHSSYAGGTGDNMFEASLSWGQQIYYSYRPFTDYTNYFWDACNFAS
jgi:cell wall-associated NlpC family hydrolase